MKIHFRFLLAAAFVLASSSTYALEGFPPGNTNTATPSLTVTQSIATSGSPTALTVTGAAHTTLATTAEANDINLNLARTVQWATGAITSQRALYIQAPTYGFVGASTITDAATVDISGAPVAGTNATLTRAHALRVEAGQTTLGGGTVIGANNVAATAGSGLTIAPAARTTGSPSLLTITAPADTTLTASTESSSVNVNTSATRQFATGALTTQRESLFQAPTYGFVAASTLTNAATLAVSGAPVAGTNATITNPYALWVQGGLSEFDGDIQVKSGQHVRTGAATNDVAGTVTLAAGSGTRTFATAYTAAPVCVCTDQTANNSVKCATTTTALTLTGTTTDVIAYACFGNPN